jgi:hypothetical protein
MHCPPSTVHVVGGMTVPTGQTGTEYPGQTQTPPS